MAKSGWKKGKTMDQLDAGLMSLRSSSLETKKFIPQERSKEDVWSRPQRLDPLTEYIGCKSYFAQMRWTWFRYEFLGKSYALEVSRFYQERNLAIDIIPGYDPQKKTEHILLKEELLSQHNIKYVIIKSAGDIEGLESRTQ